MRLKAIRFRIRFSMRGSSKFSVPLRLCVQLVMNLDHAPRCGRGKLQVYDEVLISDFILVIV